MVGRRPCRYSGFEVGARDSLSQIAGVLVEVEVDLPRRLRGGSLEKSQRKFHGLRRALDGRVGLEDRVQLEAGSRAVELSEERELFRQADRGVRRVGHLGEEPLLPPRAVTGPVTGDLK